MMIAYKHDLMCSIDNGDQTLGLSGLGGFVYENLAKLEVAKAVVTCSHACSTENLSTP